MTTPTPVAARGNGERPAVYARLGYASDREPKPAPELAMPAPARGVDPASIEYRVHAHAFNALTRALPGDLFMILSDRQAVADAIVDAIEPLIRADERNGGCLP